MKKPSEMQVGGDHYKAMPIQPHYFCHVNKLGALESNVVKYVCRHAAKGGKADLLKAKHYIELLLEWQYGDDGQTKPPPADVAGRATVAVPHLPTGWPYAQSGAVDPDEVGELTERIPELATCIAHGLTVCKVCVFPTGTKG